MNGGWFQLAALKKAQGRFVTDALTKPITKVVLDFVSGDIN
jgi:hypothetical protein